MQTGSNVGRGAVVITGASSGIGLASALHLDSVGFRVFAGVRKQADEERLRTGGSERLLPIALDVTDAGSIAAAAERVRDELQEGGLAGLVNNAGVALSAPLEFIPLEELRRQLEVNLVGQVAVTQAFLPMLRKGKGRIVNIGSVGGRVALPFVGPYAASKFGMEALTDSLRRELKPWGIKVSILEPGSVATPIWDKGLSAGQEIADRLPPEATTLYGDAIEAVRAAASETAEHGVPPLQVAKVVEQALTAPRPKTRYAVGRDAKARIALSRVLPDRMFDRLIARAMGLPTSK
jgi:NAD(P)-dependent dehydrogenase (short-subunit alcohol dehydrogenase family)